MLSVTCTDDNDKSCEWVQPENFSLLKDGNLTYWSRNGKSSLYLEVFLLSLFCFLSKVWTVSHVFNVGRGNVTPNMKKSESAHTTTQWNYSGQPELHGLYV